MRLIYLSHPEVRIDPAIPVPDWGLSPLGRDRLAAALATGWPRGAWRLVSSPEAKAREAAAMIGAARGWAVETAPETGEVDRSATGYVPHDRHEALADRLFGQPQASAEGWERAVDAQARIVAAWRGLGQAGDLMMVGHGAVGTLLWCALTGAAIARRQDQPRGGCVWEVGLMPGGAAVPVHGWHSLEDAARVEAAGRG